MKTLKLAPVAVAVAAAVLASVYVGAAPPRPAGHAQQKSADQVRRERFRHNGVIEDEGSPDPNAGLSAGGIDGAPVSKPVPTTATEAPAGFDNLTNGFSTQAQFDLDRATYEGREDIGDGLGPLYNAQACAECHQTPVTGAVSQITELVEPPRPEPPSETPPPAPEQRPTEPRGEAPWTPAQPDVPAPASPPPPAQVPPPDTEGRLNVNEATYDDLRQLRLSVTQTGRLLDYRNSLGGFKSLDQLDDIAGFSRDLILELKGKLTL